MNERKKGAKTHMGMNHGKGMGPIMRCSALIGSARCENFSAGMLCDEQRKDCMYVCVGLESCDRKNVGEL